MRKEDILLLYEYNYWANARILSKAAKVNQRDFVAPAHVSHGSLRGTLIHILAAEQVWRLRCEKGVSPSTLLSEQDLPTLELLASFWQSEETQMRAFLRQLSDTHLASIVSYRTTQGKPHEDVLWHLLFHVVNHGTQFRSEASVLLTMYGHSPGDLDVIAFLREHR